MFVNLFTCAVRDKINTQDVQVWVLCLYSFPIKRKGFVIELPGLEVLRVNNKNNSAHRLGMNRNSLCFKISE